MAYQINRYNRSLLTTVADGTINEATDLRFIGKNYAGYGEIQNENFMFLLENFSNDSPPPRPQKGQIWYDSLNRKIKFYDGTNWRAASGSDTTDANQRPTGLSVGDLWWDKTNNQLYAVSGSGYVLVGPQDVGSGTTQLVSQSIRADDGSIKFIIVAKVDGEPVYVISKDEFTIDPTLDNDELLSGFTNISQGVTLKNTNNNGITSSNFRYKGTATNAERLNGVAATDYVTYSNPTFGTVVNANGGLAINTGFSMTTDIPGKIGSISNTLGNNSQITFNTQDSTGTLVNSVAISPTGLAPSQNNKFNIGSSGARFKEIWCGDLNANDDVTANNLVVSSPSGAVKVGAGTTGQRPSSPARGMLRYNTTLNSFEGYDGSVWAPIAGVAGNYVSANTDDTMDGTYNITGDLTVDGSATASKIKATSALVAGSGTTAQRPGSPDQGTLRYNTTLNSFEGYDGSVWAPIAGSASGDFVRADVGDTMNGSYTVTGDLTVYGDVISLSDKRLKENIQTIDAPRAVDIVTNLRPTSYAFKTDPNDIKLGFIAQEVESLLPEAVQDIGDTKHVTYNSFIPVLTAALQNALLRIEELERGVSRK